MNQCTFCGRKADEKTNTVGEYLVLENCNDCRFEVEKNDGKASCAVCGGTFDEIEINMIDYDIDICGKCESNIKYNQGGSLVKKYKDYQGNEIVEGTLIVWEGIDAESEASAGVGNGGMWSWKHTLVAKANGKRLIFKDIKTNKVYEWDDIDDKTCYANHILVKE